MLEDRFGLALSTSSAAARDAYVDAIDRMLATDGHVEERLAAAIEADPDFALAHAAVARQHQLRGRIREAKTAAETASQLTDGISRREQQHVEIIQQLVSGRIPSSLNLTRAHIQDFPRDAFVVNPACGVFGSIGFSGRIGRESEHLEFLEPLVTHYGDDWWFQTVYAFALLEMGEWRRGRELAERSLAQRPDNAYAAHTLVHALYEAGEDDAATAFLAGWLPEFDPASLLHCHNWWHYALLLMGAGRHEEAWQAFSENCLPGATESPAINVFTDCAAFLWRSELAGVPRDHSVWQQVREYYESQFRRPIVFVDAHAGLPYAALGEAEALEACIDQLQELGESDQLPAGTTAASLARAYGAFATEEWGQVIELLEPLMSQVVRIGGSRAQRDLMANTLLAAYVRDGRPDDAAAFVETIHDRQPSRPVAGFSIH
jgi:tetratricopeptide (TPR) repeat protein